MGCASLSYKPPGLQIYMCENNPVAFCFGMEATWPENTIIPFFSEVRVDGPRRKKERKKLGKKEKNKT